MSTIIRVYLSPETLATIRGLTGLDTGKLVLLSVDYVNRLNTILLPSEGIAYNQNYRFEFTGQKYSNRVILSAYSETQLSFIMARMQFSSINQAVLWCIGFWLHRQGFTLIPDIVTTIKGVTYGPG